MNTGAMAYDNNPWQNTVVTPVEDRVHTMTVYSKEGIVVAVPAYNEEVAIGSIVLRSLKYAERVVVIDDGSRDRTAEIAELAGAEVIRHLINLGKGEGIKKAFMYAKECDARVLVLIDGDGQHDPDEIPLLIRPILFDEADVVNGSRFIAKDQNHVPAYRRIGQEVLTAVTNFGSKRKITDSQNGFRAFSPKAFDCFSFEHTNMAIESEMLIEASEADLRIQEVQIQVRYDVEGSTYNPIFHGLSVLFTTIGVILQRRRLLFFGTTGVLLLLLGIVFRYYEFNAGPISAVLYETFGVLSITIGAIFLFSGIVISYMQNSNPKFIRKPE